MSDTMISDYINKFIKDVIEDNDEISNILIKKIIEAVKQIKIEDIDLTDSIKDLIQVQLDTSFFDETVKLLMNKEFNNLEFTLSVTKKKKK